MSAPGWIWVALGLAWLAGGLTVAAVWGMVIRTGRGEPDEHEQACAVPRPRPGDDA
jgi:hypothetical protein